MKRKVKNSWLTLFLFVFLGISSHAQIDTAFWFAAGWVTPDHTWKEDYKLHISGQQGTIVRLRQPSAIAPNQYDTTITITSPQGSLDVVFWRDKLASATNFGFDSLEVRPAN